MKLCHKPAFRAHTFSPYGNPVPLCRDCFDLSRGVARKLKKKEREREATGQLCLMHLEHVEGLRAIIKGEA